MALAWVQLAVALAIGLLLAAAGIVKLRAFARWQDALAGYRLLPLAAVTPTACLLPVVEVGTGAALIAGFGWAAIVAMALLGLFALAMGLNLLRGRRTLDCGCDSGAKPRPIGWDLVARNLLLVAALAVVLVPAQAVPPGERAVAVAAAFLLALLVNALATMRAVAVPRRI